MGGRLLMKTRKPGTTPSFRVSARATPSAESGRSARGLRGMKSRPWLVVSRPPPPPTADMNPSTFGSSCALILLGTVLLGPRGAQGLHPERGPGTALRYHRDRRGHELRQHGRASAGRGGDRAGGPERGRVHVGGRRRRRPEYHQPGPAPSSTSTPSRRPSTLRRRRGPLAHAEARGRPRPASVHQQSAGGSTSAAGPRRPSISSRCRAPTSTRCTGRRTMERSCTSSEGSSDVTSDLQIENPQVPEHRPRPGRGARHRVEQIESALYDAYGSRQVSTIYTPNDQYWVDDGAAARVPAGSRRRSLLYVPAATASLVPLSPWPRSTPDVGPLTVNHSGQIAVGDDLVQPRAGSVARRRGHRGGAARARRRCRRPSAPASPAPPRRSRRRSRDCSCCSSSRSS